MPTATDSSTTCQHCGTPFKPRAKERFCCHGCEYVSQVLSENGLTRFYDLKGGTSVPPVGSKAFAEVETAPLVAQMEKAEAGTDAPVANSRFGIEGISCIGCVWLVESIFKRQSGSACARIDPRSGIVELHWQKAHFDIGAFARALQKIGYRLNLYDSSAEGSSTTKPIVQRIGLCAFFLMNTMLFTLPVYLGMESSFFLAPLFQILGALFATLSLIVGGGYFIQRAWQSIRNGVLHIDLPIAAGLVAGYTGSLIGWAAGYTHLIYFDFVATFVFLMLCGRWLQEYALERNRAHLQQQQTGPRGVTLLGGSRDGQKIPAEAVEDGMEYAVEPGEINPVAADPLDPKSSLSLEWINGEADPVIWPKEKTAPAGAINVGLKSARFRARESWQESLLARLLERPEDSFRERRMQIVLKYYIAAVLVIAAAGGLGWLALSGDLLKSTQVLISILIVSCPCATGVALPMCDEFANARLRRSGLFIKSAQVWERLRKVRTVVFDKTGTLTMDIPRLKNPEAVRQLDPLAAQALHILVDRNQHPVARSLREALLAAFPKLASHNKVAAIEETIGEGVAWKDPGANLWTLGKADWGSAPDCSADIGHTALRQNGLLVASFDFVEDVRDDALDAVDAIRSQQMQTTILSGDAPERVERIARQLGIESKAKCSPSDKADWIQTNAPASALMIGDGANDSLAFDAAVCRGTPVVDKSILEASADFFFFGRSLRCLPELFAVSKRRHGAIATIFSVAVVYNLGAIGLCLAGWMHPLLAAVLMPMSSIATLAIAWLLLGRRD